MEFRAEDNEMRTSGGGGSLSYTTHLTAKEGGGERRRVHNGSSCAQTLDFPNQTPPLHAPEVPDRGKLKTPSIRYRECLKNHAASIGGNVFDGCGEFMPCGEEGTIEALKCAACDCHRNFHRKEVDGDSGSSSSRRNLMLTPLQLPPPLPSPTHHHHHHHHNPHHLHHHQKFFNHPTASIVQPMNVAYGSAAAAGGTESSSEDLNMFQSVPAPPFSLLKKRFRTKFTQEQKERMLEFAEKMGWRIQKQDEDEVERFCAEVGIKRQVLKVWMHNNKSAVRKLQLQDGSNPSNLHLIEAADHPEAEAEPDVGE